jgi:FMN-dependent NADH-azoreductase
VIVSTRGAIYDAGSATAGWDHTVPPIELVLGTALGMDVRVVTVSRTLSQTLERLAGERERFDAEFAAAEAELVRLAGELG